MGLKDFLFGKKANTANESPNNAHDVWVNTMKDVQYQGNANINAPQKSPEPQRAPQSVQQPEQRKKEVEVVFDSETGEKLYVSKQQAQQYAIINFFQNGQVDNKNRPSQAQEMSFCSRLNSNEISIEDEEAFLKTIPRTAEDKNGGEKRFNESEFNQLFSTVITTPGVREIYKDLVKNHEQIYSAQLRNLLYNCETPRELNGYAFPILDQISNGNNKQLAEIRVVYEEFKKIVYGEQNEYYESLNALREKARYYSNLIKNRPAAPSQDPIHSKTFIIPNQNINNLQDRSEKKEMAPLPEVAAATCSKGQKYATHTNLISARFQNGRLISTKKLTDQERMALYESNRNKPNEDALYVNKEEKVFAEFDGAGGIGNYGGSYASNACAEATHNYIKSGRLAADYEDYNRTVQKYLREKAATTDENKRREIDRAIKNIPTPLQRMAAALQQNTLEKGMGGASTGIIVKIAEDNKSLDYLNIGDSRLYIIRNGKLMQIGKDEGEGNGISNGFGLDVFSPKQVGRIALQPDDIVFLCSDGIMGDCAEQEISQNVIDDIIKNHKDPQEIVNLFIKASIKPDDTSAIAIKIPSANNSGRQPEYYRRGN